MEYIVLILGIFLILEIKFSPRLTGCIDKDYIYIYFYYKTKSTFREVYINTILFKINKNK